jgi:excisionase family DNA binding protein
VTTGHYMVTIQEAAKRLGVKEGAIRKRIERGTLSSEKRDGRVFVFIDAPPVDDAGYDAGHATGNDGGYDAGYPVGYDALIQSQQDQIDTLKREVEDWKEEARRKDTIIMTMAQRIPELEPAPEQREAPETASEGMEGVEVPIEEKTSWWRRLFFS